MTHAPTETARKAQGARLTHQGDAQQLPALVPGHCDQCGKAVSVRRRFCSEVCRKAWWKKARNRGAQIYQLALIWRRHRGRKGTPGAGMITRIAALIDMWARVDRGGEK